MRAAEMRWTGDLLKLERLAAPRTQRAGTRLAITTRVGPSSLAAKAVTITSPKNGDPINGTVNIAAYATDDQKVTEVRAQVDGKLLCAGMSNLSCSWDAASGSQGSHTVTVTATDNSGNKSSKSVTIGENVAIPDEDAAAAEAAAAEAAAAEVAAAEAAAPLRE